jgi:uncharacterized membrane protein
MKRHSDAHTRNRELRHPVPRHVAAGLGLAVGAGLLLALVGMALLWPPHDRVAAPPGFSYNTPTVDGTVVSTRKHDCPYSGSAPGGVQQAPIRCQTSQVQLTSGPHHDIASVETNSGAGSAVLRTGDHIILATSTGPDGPAYEFFDYQRQGPLLVLGFVFALVVVAVARWRGAGALVGLVVTWLVLSRFVFPALLQGRDPLAVALVASAVVMCVVLFVAHGIRASTATALLGTLISLGLVGALSTVAVHFTHLTGLSDEVSFLQGALPHLRLDGLLTAGMIIGALGVLNDVTVTQASAVWEIHDASPGATAFVVYRAGMRVGRDHIASSVYTLVLAYAGAALPLLLLFDLGGRSFTSVVTSEIIAQEVVRTLVGALGLVASVPLTTGLAALAVTAGSRSERRHRRAPLPTERRPPRRHHS